MEVPGGRQALCARVEPHRGGLLTAQLLEEIRGEKSPHERFDPRRHGVPEIGHPVKHDDIGRTTRSPSDGKEPS